ncbi:hypothetical protein SDC9_178166 [bioreactor metagenome]|uniref:Uncharacterized protein n=1 Tax=bioreactor metagenome TaxID=1076179 RepID=A0A645GV83_9ZZZZ
MPANRSCAGHRQTGDDRDELYGTAGAQQTQSDAIGVGNPIEQLLRAGRSRRCGKSCQELIDQ